MTSFDKSRRTVAAVLQAAAILGALLLFPCSEAPAGDQEKSTVVARVNGVPITSLALKSMAARLDGEPEAVRKSAMDRLVFMEMASQKAKAAGITATGQEIDEALAGLKEELRSSELFRKMLTERMMTEEDLRAELERDVVIRKLYRKEVLSKVVVRPDELKREIEEVKKEPVPAGEKQEPRTIRRTAEKRIRTRQEEAIRASWLEDMRAKTVVEMVEEK